MLMSNKSMVLAIFKDEASADAAASRVHTGVHYPGDAVVGSLIGEGTGQAVAGLVVYAVKPGRPSGRRDRGRAALLQAGEA
jgi:hypothetical protein